MSDLFDLSNRVAVVTGGVGLIGQSVCETLHDHGASVYVADLDTESGTAFAESLGENAFFVEMDATSFESVSRTVEEIIADSGRIDVLVNAAYPRNENYGRAYESVEYSDWLENLTLHLGSYFAVTRAVSEQMVRQDTGGSIINFGSIYGVQAPDFSVYEGTDMTSPVEYAAIKGGIINLTRYLASYLGEHGVRANAISPGGVFEEQPEEFVEAYEKNTPLGRMANPEDLQGAVVYLASGASAYVTGHNLVVDGGWTIT